MQYNPSEIDSKSAYKLLSGLVIPRPIGWISSIDEHGVPNLAPFSFFNAVGDDPPHVMFSATKNKDLNKDTLNNVLATKQFVVNMVTEDLVEKMNTTSRNLPPDENEFDLAGLTPIPSVVVRPPRVKECVATLECELAHHFTIENNKFGGATIMVGKVVLFHVDEKILLEDYRINMDTYRPVARLAGSFYSKMGELFSLKR
ncbi:MAG TPA: flavin reductase family protein [Parasegetibacter sp.]